MRGHLDGDEEVRGEKVVLARLVDYSDHPMAIGGGVAYDAVNLARLEREAITTVAHAENVATRETRHRSL